MRLKDFKHPEKCKNKIKDRLAISSYINLTILIKINLLKPPIGFFFIYHNMRLESSCV